MLAQPQLNFTENRFILSNLVNNDEKTFIRNNIKSISITGDVNELNDVRLIELCLIGDCAGLWSTRLAGNIAAVLNFENHEWLKLKQQTMNTTSFLATKNLLLTTKSIYCPIEKDDVDEHDMQKIYKMQFRWADLFWLFKSNCDFDVQPGFFEAINTILNLNL